MNTKQAGTAGFAIMKSSSDLPRKQDMNDSDQAYDFLTSALVSQDAAARVDLKKLRRQVDWHIVPIMFLCYTMQFIDKVSLNVYLVLILPGEK
jgi:hypothetical protein